MRLKVSLVIRDKISHAYPRHFLHHNLRCGMLASEGRSARLCSIRTSPLSVVVIIRTAGNVLHRLGEVILVVVAGRNRNCARRSACFKTLKPITIIDIVTQLHKQSSGLVGLMSCFTRKSKQKVCSSSSSSVVVENSYS